MYAIVPSLIKHLEERYSSLNTFRFDMSFPSGSEGREWVARITCSKTETDAVLEFEGTGMTPKSAFASLAVSVIMDQPKNGAALG